jgi:hypothetical protein
MKELILERLHQLIEAEGYRVVPQDYSAEFRQTGSGKSMFGLSNKLVISDEKLNSVLAQIATAKQIAKKYREAYKAGEQGLFVNWMGKKILMRIPKELRNATDANGDPVDYSHYFDVPTVGDGGFQFKLFRNGNIVGGHVKSRPEMTDIPDLTSATDAGYEKTYDDRLKYFFVKAGILGKYQDEAGFFNAVLGTPAMDAGIKVRAIFHDEIVSFLTKDKKAASYTSDNKGKEAADKMELDKKIEKIRKDIENIIKKPIYGNKTWLEFKDYLLRVYGKPDAIFKLDMDKEIENFMEKYKVDNIFKPIKKPEIGLPKDELDTWEKEQKEKLARIAAARARMKK